MIQLLTEHESCNLADLWAGTCERMKRLQEFRSLNMVHAHVKDLISRHIIRADTKEMYSLR